MYLCLPYCGIVFRAFKKDEKRKRVLCFPDMGPQLSSLNQGLKVAAFHGKMWKPSSNRENEGSYQSWALWYGTKRYCEQGSPESRWWISLADANPWPSFRSRLAKEHESAAEFGEKAPQAGQGMKANDKLYVSTTTFYPLPILYPTWGSWEAPIHPLGLQGAGTSFNRSHFGYGKQEIGGMLIFLLSPSVGLGVNDIWLRASPSHDTSRMGAEIKPAL